MSKVNSFLFVFLLFCKKKGDRVAQQFRRTNGWYCARCIPRLHTALYSTVHIISPHSKFATSTEKKLYDAKKYRMLSQCCVHWKWQLQLCTTQGNDPYTPVKGHPVAQAQCIWMWTIKAKDAHYYSFSVHFPFLLHLYIIFPKREPTLSSSTIAGAVSSTVGVLVEGNTYRLMSSLKKTREQGRASVSRSVCLSNSYKISQNWRGSRPPSMTTPLEPQSYDRSQNFKFWFSFNKDWARGVVGEAKSGVESWATFEAAVPMII